MKYIINTHHLVEMLHGTHSQYMHKHRIGVTKYCLIQQLTFTYDEVPLLLIGSIVSSPTTGQYIKGQDGNYYTINEVYQVIGVNEIVQLDMTQEDNYVISSSFTTDTNNTKVYYQYTSSSGNATWNTFTIHA